MKQRYICEAVWHGEASPVAKKRWPLGATDEQAAMEEMLALHATENQSVDTGHGIGHYSFMLVKVADEEWRALRDGS